MLHKEQLALPSALGLQWSTEDKVWRVQGTQGMFRGADLTTGSSAVWKRCQSVRQNVKGGLVA